MSVSTPRWCAVALALSVGGAAFANPDDVREVERCLTLQDVACADAVVASRGLATSSDARDLFAAAETSFAAGRYPEAMERMDAAVAAGAALRYGEDELYRRTLFATAGWVEVPRGRFRIRYRPGVDAILVEDAAEALARTDRYVTPLLGAVPPGNTVVELFPDGRSFIAASSLTRDDVEATGVVALSKWTRLLVNSPRALGRGYPWQDTLSHEYIHLVVAHNSYDRAPVWLQEGLARYLDNRWKSGTDAFSLGVSAEGYLAEALAEDDLVPFSEMHPSLAKIKVFRPDGTIDRAASARRSQLAYAQLSTLIQYAVEKAGEGVLKDTLTHLREGMEAPEALAKATGVANLDLLLGQWEAWIRAQGLEQADVGELPTVLDGGDDVDNDPVLSERRDLANHLRLGDLLAGRSRWRAALVEYDKARDEEDPNSPLLANRRAEAHVALGDLDRARALLRETLSDYPEFALSHRNLGLLERRAGRLTEAASALREASTLAPFDLDLQVALAELEQANGRPEAAAERQRLVRILRRGGLDEPPPPIHEIYGTYELPRSEEVADPPSAEEVLRGRPAPDFAVTTLDGSVITLEDLRGKVVLLDFWATWCGPCRTVMPALSELATARRAEGLEIVGLSDEPAGQVSRFVRKEEAAGRTYAYPLALENGSVRADYGVRSLPTLVLIDREGIVRGFHIGAGGLEALRDRVLGLLAETP